MSIGPGGIVNCGDPELPKDIRDKLCPAAVSSVKVREKVDLLIGLDMDFQGDGSLLPLDELTRPDARAPTGCLDAGKRCYSAFRPGKLVAVEGTLGPGQSPCRCEPDSNLAWWLLAAALFAGALLWAV